MSMAQRYAGYLEREAHHAATPVKAEAMRQAANKLRELDRENAALRADAARLDWLADKDNEIGNVQLPTHCVTANLDSLRGAIDMAMREQELDCSPRLKPGDSRFTETDPNRT